MTSVALIEDDAVYRDLLERLLHASGRYRVRHAFGNAEDALRVLPQQPTNLALVDINLPGQPEPAAVLQLRETCPALRCLILSLSEDTEHLFSALQAGAAGYLLKTSTAERIVAALDELVAGGAPMSPIIARRVLAAFARPLSTPGRDDLSPRTVKNHLYRVYEKLAVRSRTEAVLKWLGR